MLGKPIHDFWELWPSTWTKQLAPHFKLDRSWKWILKEQVLARFCCRSTQGAVHIHSHPSSIKFVFGTQSMLKSQPKMKAHLGTCFLNHTNFVHCCLGDFCLIASHADLAEKDPLGLGNQTAESSTSGFFLDYLKVFGLALRDIGQSLILDKIGNGQVHLLWLDNWHGLGPLYKKFGADILHNARRFQAKVSSIIQSGMWRWPRARNGVMQSIIAKPWIC